MAVMEVSSQGLMLNRTAGIPFEIGIFTNLEPDHIGPDGARRALKTTCTAKVSCSASAASVS